MITRGLLISIIKRRLNDGNPSSASSFKDEDIAAAIGQVINAKLKADYIGTTLNSGETIPEGTTLLTYTGATALPVYKYGNTSAATLPALPVKLPRDMGLFHVSRDSDEGNPFIPTQAGQFALYSKLNVINVLLGQIGYQQNGYKIVFDQDISQTIPTVMVKLMVADVLSLGDYDPLPITPEMESEVCMMVEQILTKKVMQDKVDDPSAVQS